MTCYRIPKAPNKRAFSVHTVQKIRTFKSLDAASRFIDMRLAQKPAFNFNIQQSGETWIVSRVIGA